MRGIAILAALVVAISCSDSNDPAPSVRGEWFGVFDSRSMDVTLTEAGGEVGGSVIFDKAGINPVTSAISGSQTGGTVTIGWKVDDKTLNFYGQISGVTLRGRVNGAGWQNEPLTFSRKN
jgi:hypothetical protein